MPSMQHHTLEHSCSQLALQSKLPIVGTAGFKPLQIFFELEGPWENNIAASPEYPAHLEALSFDYMRKTKIPLAINAILPEPTNTLAEPSAPGYARVILAKQVTYGVQAAKLSEWLVPKDQLSEFFKQLLDPYQDGLTPLQSSPWSLEKTQEQSYYFVCCHRSRDRCCGTFGLPLYQHIKKQAQASPQKIKVWQCSHLGGHKYAPTLLELPSLRCWGHLDLAQVDAVLAQQGSLAQLGHQYRGSAGLAHPYEQAAEWELFKEFGWDWLNYHHEKVESQWSAEKKEGEVRFYFNKAARQVNVQVSGSYASPASCRDLAVKDQPLFTCKIAL